MQTEELLIQIRKENEIRLELVTCQNCGVTGATALIDEGPNYNDFGIRFCNYCGLPTDETGSVVP